MWRMQEIVPTTPQLILLEVKLHDTCVGLNIFVLCILESMEREIHKHIVEKCE